MPAVASEVVNHAKPRTEARIVDGLHAGLILPVVLVVPNSSIEAPAWTHVPLVVEEKRLGSEVGTLALSEKRIPLNSGEASCSLSRTDVEKNILPDINEVPEDAEIASRLIVVLGAELMKFVVAADDIVAAPVPRRQEVCSLGQPVLVAAVLVLADAAESRRPSAPARRDVADHRPEDAVPEQGAASHDCEVLRRVLAFNQELIGQDAVVVNRGERERVSADPQAA